MGLAALADRISQPQPLEKLEQKVIICDPAEGAKGRFRAYRGQHNDPTDQEPFDSHLLFTIKGTQMTSIVGRERGLRRLIVPNRGIGHLYHSFSEIEDPEQIPPQPFRLKVPVFKAFAFNTVVETRTDLLTVAHLDGVETVEAMCTRAIALGTHRYLEGIPSTVQLPETYLEQ
jgi:hypothetical protein